MADSSLLSLKYDALTRQLERMRSMQYAYFAKFFSWIILTAGALVVLYLLPFSAAHVLFPFLVITAGTQASFYLHFVDFARVYARALEERINQLLGEKILLGAELEDFYFYPLDQPKLSGFNLAHPTRFFSIYTFHWLGVWSFFFLFGLFEAWAEGGTTCWFYVELLSGWALLHFSYLGWYFYGQRDLKKIAQILATTYPDLKNNLEKPL